MKNGTLPAIFVKIHIERKEGLCRYLKTHTGFRKLYRVMP